MPKQTRKKRKTTILLSPDCVKSTGDATDGSIILLYSVMFDGHERHLSTCFTAWSAVFAMRPLKRAMAYSDVHHLADEGAKRTRETPQRERRNERGATRDSRCKVPGSMTGLTPSAHTCKDSRHPMPCFPQGTSKGRRTAEEQSPPSLCRHTCETFPRGQT